MTLWKSKYIYDATFQPLTALQRIQLKSLCAAARRLDERHAIPATSSNFSLRCGPNHFFISKSGLHKRDLEPNHFIRGHLNGIPVHPMSPKPSDETLLHSVVYRNDPNAGTVLHCHAPELEILKSPQFIINGHELLKALGKNSHTEPFSIPVIKNSQNMQELALEVEQNIYNQGNSVIAFVLENHGIYCIGRNTDQAMARLEAILHLICI